MKNKNGIYIIGVDHGYGNTKTANCCFPTGVESSETEPIFKNDLLIYQSGQCVSGGGAAPVLGGEAAEGVPGVLATKS